MATYTTKPSTRCPGYVDIYQNGWCSGSCPADQAEAFIQHSINSERRHWDDIVARRYTDNRLVVADGHAYHIGKESGKNIPSHLKGFGGDRWEIAFHDGRVIICDSLWHYGDVPSEWRDYLPDNATLTPLR